MKAFLPLVVLASCTPEIDSYRPLDVAPARDLDILFVIDDSSNRARYDQMAEQIDDLQAGLASVDGQLPSLHVGVVTTDLGTSGTVDAQPVGDVGNCRGTGKGGVLQTFDAGLDVAYLEDLRGPSGRIRNFASGDLAAELRALTNPENVPVGCDFEQPLEAMRRALDPATNPGFIRPGAKLAIVFLTNEDDCSLQRGALLDANDPSLGLLTRFRCTAQGVICDDDPSIPGAHANCRPREGSQLMVDVSEYEAFLASYKPDRRDISVSAVAGPRTSFTTRIVGSPVLQPSCTGPSGPAYPAVRIGALVDSFGGALIDSCTQDAAYDQITAPILERQTSCFPELLRSEGDDCTVLEVSGSTETELERCTDGMTGPCWYSYADATACPEGDNLGIAVRRAATSPVDARIEARCFVKEAP